MVFDFGCRASADVLTQIFPAVHSALACIAIVAGLAVLGRCLRKGAEFQAADILSGWGLVAAFMTTVSVLYARPLAVARLIVFGAMLLAAIPAVKQKYFNSPIWCLVFVPGLVILVAINILGISEWDDFSHWVPNALYVWQNDGVPGRDLPVSYSFWPGYPHAVPFLTYLASHLAGGFLVQGGAMANFLLLLAFAAMLTEIGHRPFQAQSISLINVGRLCFALLAVTFLNPNFNASFTITNQGDTPTMVAVGALGLMFWNLIDALVQKDPAARQKLFLQILLVSTLLVLVKQGNLALLGLLIIAFLVVSWKNKVLKEASILVLPVLIVAFLFRYIWQHHVDMELAGSGKGLNPIHEWRLDLLAPLLRAMGREGLRKSGCFGLILVASIYGIASLFRAPDRVRNFAILAGIVGGGYICFLMICYLGGAFNEREILKAASFYRYATHVGLLNIGLVWIAAPRLSAWLQERMKISPFTPWNKVSAGTCLSVVLALPLLLLIHPAWLTALPSYQVCSLRNEARLIAGRLPDDARLAIIEPEAYGKFSHIVNFELSLEERKDRPRASVVSTLNRSKIDKLSSRIKAFQQGDIDAIYVQRAKQVPVQIMGFTNNAAPVFLLREGREWKQAPP
jgi:hypothetical protein